MGKLGGLHRPRQTASARSMERDGVGQSCDGWWGRDLGRGGGGVGKAEGVGVGVGGGRGGGEAKWVADRVLANLACFPPKDLAPLKFLNLPFPSPEAPRGPRGKTSA